MDMKIAMALGLLFCCASVQSTVAQADGQTCSVWSNNHEILSQLVTENSALKEEMSQVKLKQGEITQQMNQKLDEQAQLLNEQGLKLDELTRNLEDIEDRMNATESELVSVDAWQTARTEESKTNATFMSIGCRSQTINMTCPAEESRITIRKATYGSFARTCSESCCPPNMRRDCTEDMQTVHSEIFEYLQQQCDGEQSCSYEFNGYVRDTTCLGDADYLQVFYDCSQIAQGPVGFAAQNLERNSLSTQEVVPWCDVFTNFGGHYNPQTYSFVCPYNGVYVFSATITTYDEDILISVYKNNQVLFRVLANNNNDDYDSSSGSVVVECLSGDVVWAEVAWPGNFEYHPYNYNLFSGFLLNKL